MTDKVLLNTKLQGMYACMEGLKNQLRNYRQDVFETEFELGTLDLQIKTLEVLQHGAEVIKISGSTLPEHFKSASTAPYQGTISEPTTTTTTKAKVGRPSKK
jgi:hypothetical protein